MKLQEKKNVNIMPFCSSPSLNSSPLRSKPTLQTISIIPFFLSIPRTKTYNNMHTFNWLPTHDKALTNCATLHFSLCPYILIQLIFFMSNDHLRNIIIFPGFYIFSTLKVFVLENCTYQEKKLDRSSLSLPLVPRWHLEFFRSKAALTNA